MCLLCSRRTGHFEYRGERLQKAADHANDVHGVPMQEIKASTCPPSKNGNDTLLLPDGRCWLYVLRKP